ncbi:MAG: LacI family DNA-binding transcriptional regulator [Sphaerochaetaceae bacterium]
MANRSATIKDVAREAGVSIATVSRVLNRLGNVNGKTSEKVMVAVLKLNYQSNQIARSLKTNTTKLIGFITPEVDNLFFMQIFHNLEIELAPYGYSIILCSSDNSVEEEAKRFSMLLERNVDGIIFVPATNDCSNLEPLMREDVPVVMVDRYASGLDVDMVLSNNLSGAYQLTKALILEGHVRIGFIGGNPHLNNAMQRFEGYRKAMIEAGLAIDESFVCMEGTSQEAGFAMMSKLMHKENRPNAFVLENDSTHLGASAYLMGEVPYEQRKNIVFASYDFLYYAPLLTFCHYAMGQPLDFVGISAARLMVNRLKFNKDAEPRKIVLEPRMKVMVAHGGILTDPINQDAIEPAINKLH